MTNDAVVGADRSPASKPRETDEPEGPTCYACTALVDDSGPTNDTGALLRLCPVCGRAWPLFAEGDRGAMARDDCDRVNRRLDRRPPGKAKND